MARGDELETYHRDLQMENAALNRVETALPGVFLFQPELRRDVRGFFIEVYHRAKFVELGMTDQFVQDNHSCSRKGVLRGLHYQLKHPQAKLCWVISGQVLDVAVDIRVGSPTFGKWVKAMLCADKHNQIYIPAGFAHGFVVLSDSAEFFYKCTDFYDPDDNRGISWNDPDLNIAWDVQMPSVSPRDELNPYLRKIPPELLPRYPK